MKFYISDDLGHYKSLVKSLGLSPNDDVRGIGWCDAEKVDPILGDGEKCPLCGRAVSLKRWMDPRKIKLSNTRFPDRISWWILEPLIFSERVKNAYECEGLTGIKQFIPVEVVKVSRKSKKALPPPLYFSAEIPFNESIRVDEKKTIIIGQPYDWKCELCNPFGTTCDRLEQLRLDTSKWDGTDVLQVYAVGIIYSERFYDLVKRYNFTNFNLVDIEEYKKNYGPEQ